MRESTKQTRQFARVCFFLRRNSFPFQSRPPSHAMLLPPFCALCYRPGLVLPSRKEEEEEGAAAKAILPRYNPTAKQKGFLLPSSLRRISGGDLYMWWGSRRLPPYFPGRTWTGRAPRIESFYKVGSSYKPAAAAGSEGRMSAEIQLYILSTPPVFEWSTRVAFYLHLRKKSVFRSCFRLPGLTMCHLEMMSQRLRTPTKDTTMVTKKGFGHTWARGGGNSPWHLRKNSYSPTCGFGPPIGR